MTVIRKKRFALIINSEDNLPKITKALSALWDAKKSDIIEIIIVEYCSLNDAPDRFLHLMFDISVCGIDFVVTNEYSEVISGFLENKYKCDTHVIKIPENYDLGFRNFVSIILGNKSFEKKITKKQPAKKTTMAEIMKKVEIILMRYLEN